MQTQTKAVPVPWVAHGRKAKREAFRVAILAARTDLRAPCDRIPGGIRPFDGGVVTHKRSWLQSITAAGDTGSASPVSNFDNRLYWKRPVSLPCCVCMMTTTSEPPKVISPPMTAPNRKPWATAWFKSFSMVEVLFVANTLCKRTNSEYSLAQHRAGDESLWNSIVKASSVRRTPRSCSTGQLRDLFSRRIEPTIHI